jgi:hypothetical protein
MKQRKVVSGSSISSSISWSHLYFKLHYVNKNSIGREKTDSTVLLLRRNSIGVPIKKVMKVGCPHKGLFSIDQIFTCTLSSLSPYIRIRPL